MASLVGWGEEKRLCSRLRRQEKNGNCLAAPVMEDEAKVEGLCFDGGEQEIMGSSTEKTKHIVWGSVWGWGDGIIIITENGFESSLCSTMC